MIKIVRKPFVEKDLTGATKFYNVEHPEFTTGYIKNLDGNLAVYQRVEGKEELIGDLYELYDEQLLYVLQEKDLFREEVKFNCIKGTINKQREQVICFPTVITRDKDGETQFIYMYQCYLLNNEGRTIERIV